MLYEYALRDTNPYTAGRHVPSLPRCQQSLYSDGCLDEEPVWVDADKKPWINMSLMRTCKQVYYEARDEVLYRNRHFDATAVLNSQFKQIMKEAPRFTFWQHIQHVHLILRPVDNREQWRRHVQSGIQGLTSFLRGGRKLKSFQLSWEFTQHTDQITKFEDLRVSGSIIVTQCFDDASMSDGRSKEAEREWRIRRLLKSMQGLRRKYRFPLLEIVLMFVANADAQYDVVVSQTPDRSWPHVKRSEMQIRLSTREGV